MSRGGAGNIEALRQTQKASADLEASQSATDSYTNNLVPTDYKREEQQYAHQGRGGAGNYYRPKELEQTGRFHDADTSHILGDGTPAPTSKESMDPQGKSASLRTYGRGGAGNYAYGAGENEEQVATKAREEQEKQAKLKADIEAGVKESLVMPEKAKLSDSEPF